MKLSVDCPYSINHRHGTPTDEYDGWRRGAVAGPRGGRALAFVSKAGHPSEPADVRFCRVLLADRPERRARARPALLDGKCQI
jgi:hypothetical protein